MPRGRDPHDDPPRRKPSRREPEGPPTTLGGLVNADAPDWAWFSCDNPVCTYHVGIRFQTLIDRHGAATLRDDLLKRMKCTRCGHVGASMRHPSWDVRVQGWQRFPNDT